MAAPDIQAQEVPLLSEPEVEHLGHCKVTLPSPLDDASPIAPSPRLAAIGFKPRSAEELYDVEEEPIDWLWEPYLPRGSVVLFAAYNKVGKSTLSYSLCVSMVQGRPFLGFPTKKTKVLILAVEEHKRDTKNRLTRFGLTRADKTNLIIHNGVLPPSQEFVHLLTDYVKTHSIDLVMIDTMQMFWDLDDENDNSAIMKVMKPLIDMTRRTNITLLLIHHQRKAGGEGGRGVRGGSALFGAVDQLLELEKRDGAPSSQRVLTSAGRYDDTPTQLYIDLVENEYVSLGESLEEMSDRQKDKILDCLNGLPLNVKEICLATELAEKMVRRACRKLASQGHLLVSGSGRKGDALMYQKVQG